MLLSQALLEVAGLTGLVAVLAIAGFMSNMLKKSVSGLTVVVGAVAGAEVGGGRIDATVGVVVVHEEFSSAAKSLFDSVEVLVGFFVVATVAFAGRVLGASVNAGFSHRPSSYFARIYFSITSTPAFLSGFRTRFPPFPPKYKRAAFALPIIFMTLISSRCQW